MPSSRKKHGENIDGQISIDDLIAGEVIDELYSSKELGGLIAKLEKAKKSAEKREKEEQERKNREERERKEREEKREAHIREVTCMDLPLE